MIGLLQRVTSACVTVDGTEVGAIGRGILVLAGVERGDDRDNADRLLERLLGYRVFPDAEGKMNLSVRDVGGGLLLVPQFTLVADTTKGMRPGFSSGATPEHGRTMFEYLAAQARAIHGNVAGGVFGAEMQVTLTNDGPVTFWLRVAPRSPLA
jgi:D-tyrosyl-tRNA(Tyr) deacylase